MMQPIFAFWILVMLILGGFAVLMPLARVLARAMERRLESGGETGGGAGADLLPILRRIEERIDALEGEQGHMREHQEFLDALLEKREPPSLPEPDSQNEE